jgi:asparagine synthase (glutamine-hydrolysing)
MSNEDGSIWVALNGEIYNYRELRSRLEGTGHRFRTASDTEVVVHAYEEFGAEFPKHLSGMFAIVLWDGSARRLLVVRDRMGEKPLYYVSHSSRLYFASELKALLAVPDIPKAIDPSALDQYMSFLFVPGPASILQGVRKLDPAHMIVAECSGGAPKLVRYWDLPSEPLAESEVPHLDEMLRQKLEHAVRQRLRSDVPLGCFLSGGVDSSIVAHLMSREMATINTFSIGFKDPVFDETKFARLVAERLGTHHLQETVDSSTMAPEEFLQLVWFMDEPFGDSSFIPSYWVSRTARRHVKVVLSGDGSDELFGGYPRYRYIWHMHHTRFVPAGLLAFAARRSSSIQHLVAGMPYAAREFGRRVQKTLELAAATPELRMHALVAYFSHAEKAKLYHPSWITAGESDTTFREWSRAYDGAHLDPRARFMLGDIRTSLVDDSLMKVDRSSMACGLEVRTPFLDHELVELAVRIPPGLKVDGRGQKVILKRAFADILPHVVRARRKQGFEVPFGRWFQESRWRELILDLMSASRLREQGIFDANAVVVLRDQLLSNPEAKGLGISAYQLRHRVWSLLVFQAWCQRNGVWR